MHHEELEGVELSLQGFLREERMNVAVTWPAKPREPVLHLVPVEFALVSFVCMARFRDEMMLRQMTDVPSAKLANARAHSLFVPTRSNAAAARMT